VLVEEVLRPGPAVQVIENEAIRAGPPHFS
jgi:hypothetical protein